MKEYERLRVSRVIKNVSQCEIAKLIGVDSAILSRYERYGVPLPKGAMKKLRGIFCAPGGGRAAAADRKTKKSK